MSDGASKTDLERRRAEAGTLGWYLLKYLPIAFLVGGGYGVFQGIALQAGIVQLVGIAVAIGFAGMFVLTPVFGLKWWMLRRDTQLEPQQQLFQGLDSCKVRAIIALAMFGITLISLVTSPSSSIDWFGVFLIPIVIFGILSLFAFVLREMGMIPE